MFHGLKVDKYVLLFQVKAFSEMTGGSLFADDIMSRYPGLKGGKHWKDEHDLLLLRALLKYVTFISSDLYNEFRNHLTSWNKAVVLKLRFIKKDFDWSCVGCIYQ